MYLRTERSGGDLLADEGCTLIANWEEGQVEFAVVGRRARGGAAPVLKNLRQAGNGRPAALPALRELTAEGGLLFDEIDGDALTSLTELRLRGAVLADGAVFPRKAPSVVTLALEIRSDVFGTECPIEQLDELDPAGYPALRHLDLSRAEFDAGDFGTLEALAGSPILPQLESLKIESLQIQELETDGDPLEALTGLARAFTHLALSVAGEINVEGAARVLSLQTC
ncbi:hypothetical protein ABT120_29705 [Nonomuraea angiospora]|uniref:hypothetical protein n=1 Tax=Nonomuraea angiospora TaxID=46172 RepID=UPI0033258B5B